MLQPASEYLGISKNWYWKGVGYCSGHFGELIQGAFTTRGGGIKRGLVTLPCRSVGAISEVIVRPGSGVISVPDGKMKIYKAIQYHCLRVFGCKNLDISVNVKSNVPAGIGMGSSTSDIVSSLRALDNAFGRKTNVDALLCSVMQAESACDPTMLDHTVKLFAHREGRIIDDFHARFPPLIIVGINLMPGRIFCTESNPPAEYSDCEIKQFDSLIFRLKHAIQNKCCREIGAIATESALINQRKYPKDRFDELIKLNEAIDALGVCISHSGTIAGLMFDALDDDLDARLSATFHEVNREGFSTFGLFRI